MLLQKLYDDLNAFNAKLDELEKKLLPNPATKDKDEKQFLKTIEVYDQYQTKLNNFIPFERQIQNTFDFFVTNEAQRELTIQNIWQSSNPDQ